VLEKGEARRFAAVYLGVVAPVTVTLSPQPEFISRDLRGDLDEFLMLMPENHLFLPRFRI
jgi:hypothetical protein